MPEAAAEEGDAKTLYRVEKDLSSSNRKSGMPLKDDNGKTLSTYEEQIMQWRHHFEAVVITARNRQQSMTSTYCSDQI
jgi:hypothetical protein